MFQCSNFPMFKCFNVSMFQCSIIPLVHWSTGQLVHWSIGPWVECKILNVKCQMSSVINEMSNVNKVKLLSERTSGVPPVIFIDTEILHDAPCREKHNTLSLDVFGHTWNYKLYSHICENICHHLFWLRKLQLVLKYKCGLEDFGATNEKTMSRGDDFLNQ